MTSSSSHTRFRLVTHKRQGSQRETSKRTSGQAPPMLEELLDGSAGKAGQPDNPTLLTKLMEAHDGDVLSNDELAGSLVPLVRQQPWKVPELLALASCWFQDLKFPPLSDLTLASWPRLVGGVGKYVERPLLENHIFYTIPRKSTCFLQILWGRGTWRVANYNLPNVAIAPFRSKSLLSLSNYLGMTFAAFSVLEFTSLQHFFYKIQPQNQLPSGISRASQTYSYRNSFSEL